MINQIGQTEFVHKDLYGVALEVSKKFVAKTETRPILQYTLHTVEGDLLATDSHSAIQIKDIHGFTEEYLVNPKNYMFAKGTYPELEKIIAPEGHKKAIELSKEQIKIWMHVFKSQASMFKAMKTYIKTVKINFLADGVELETKVNETDVYKTVLPITNYEKPDFDRVAVSVEYLRNAFEAHFKLNSEVLNISLGSAFKPMILDDGKMVKTVVLPVRIFD